MLYGLSLLSIPAAEPELFLQAIRIVEFFGLPAKLLLVAVATILAVRLCDALAGRVGGMVSGSAGGATPLPRSRVRLATLSNVAKSVGTALCLGAGTLSGLSLVGVDVLPFVAGAGLVGIAATFASQSLLKDLIGGLCIIVEDHYGIGDTITVGKWRGVVEELNLRTTQLRDPAGRIVTIPNGDVKEVARDSRDGARAEVVFPVSYRNDLREALRLAFDVSAGLASDPVWADKIAATPEPLSVEGFGDKAISVRASIPTKLDSKEDVEREFRIRLAEQFRSNGVGFF